jgi:asparagine synthase (glutamine-hydrolysing)
LPSRLPIVQRLDAPRGSKFTGEIRFQLLGLMGDLKPRLLSDSLDVRYPFLYRPLVELALQLRPEWVTRPFQTKWILREALSGILPDAIRLRTGKGTIGARLRWAFTKEKDYLDDLLAKPILGELGCIGRQRLRMAVQKAQQGGLWCTGTLYNALALESWLAVHSRCRRPALIAADDIVGRNVIKTGTLL